MEQYVLLLVAVLWVWELEPEVHRPIEGPLWVLKPEGQEHKEYQEYNLQARGGQ